MTARTPSQLQADMEAERLRHEEGLRGHYDDKPSETACNMAVTTQEGDLDIFSRPLRAGT